MKEIFISYSTVDTSAAETVRNLLEKNGISCWMAPRDIPGGSNYTKEIPIAIRNCKIFVLILSENAQNSHWVLKELDSAVNSGKVILPFMLEDFVLNDEFDFLLTGAQRYSAYQKKAEVIETLIGRIRGILDVSPSSDKEDDLLLMKDASKHKTSGKTTPVFFDEKVCPSCGSSELKALPKRVLRKGLNEMTTMLLIPLMGTVCMMFVFFIGALALSKYIGLVMLLSLIGFVGGAIWGNIVSKKIVVRKRIRSRVSSTCYRCNRCCKVFRIDEPID